jgi:hypothetical protein
VDTDLAPRAARLGIEWLRTIRLLEAGLTRELLVDRLAPEDHCGSISP